jgi:predicted dehydrogenase
MNPLNIGFVGCGRWSGKRIYPSLGEAGLALVAVCGRDKEKTEARARAYGIEQIFSDPVRMCRETEFDAVLVVAGPRGHYDVARALIPLGIPIWMEKPCAENADQAGELSAMAQEAGVHVQVGFNYRYTAGILKARELMANGTVAPPATISVRWWLGEPDTGRFLLHYACHAVDLLHALVPGGLVNNLDMHIDHHRQDGYDWYLVTFRGKDGCIAVLELGARMCASGHWSRVDLMSNDGLLSIRDFTEVIHHATAPWGDMLKPGDRTWDGDRVWRTEPLFGHASIEQSWGYVPELVRFRETVQGLADPEATLHEAAWGMQVLERLQASTTGERGG